MFLEHPGEMTASHFLYIEFMSDLPINSSFSRALLFLGPQPRPSALGPRPSALGPRPSAQKSSALGPKILGPRPSALGPKILGPRPSALGPKILGPKILAPRPKNIGFRVFPSFSNFCTRKHSETVLKNIGFRVFPSVSECFRTFPSVSAFPSFRPGQPSTNLSCPCVE